MKEQYYAFYLDDPAVASFCSFDKLYVGTLSELQRAVENTKGKRGYEDTNTAFKAFLDGCEGGTHRVAQHDVPILTPVEFKASSEMKIGAREWEHLNAWQWPYEMKIDGAEVRQIIVKHRGEYVRLMKATIQNLCYEDTVGQWVQVKSGFWGNGFLLDVQTAPDNDVYITTLLYEVESRSKLLREETARMTDPEQLIFDAICDEIFGDG